LGSNDQATYLLFLDVSIVVIRHHCRRTRRYSIHGYLQQYHRGRT